MWKGVCLGIFYLYYWYDSNSSWPLINRRNCFRFRIRRNVRLKVTVEHSDSSVCMTTRSQNFRQSEHLLFVLQICSSTIDQSNQRPGIFSIWSPWCVGHRGVRLCSMMHPQSLTPRYDAHSRIWISDGMHTEEFLQNSNILAKSTYQICKYFTFYHGPGCNSNHEQNGGRKSRDTLPLTTPFDLNCGRVPMLLPDNDQI